MRGLGGLTRILGGAMSFLMGPWGLAIGMGLTFLPGLIDALKSNTEVQRETLEEQRKKLRDMSTKDFYAMRDKKIMEAFLERSGKAINKVDIHINGNPYGSLEAGGLMTIDDFENLMDIGYND